MVEAVGGVVAWGAAATMAMKPTATTILESILAGVTGGGNVVRKKRTLEQQQIM